MSLLLIDVGNTKCKWRYETAESTQEGDVSSLQDVENIVESIAASTGAPQQIAIACVKSSEYKQHMAQCLERRFAVSPVVARLEKEACGLVCSYEDPSRMGIDRWLAMIAVRHRHEGAFCVVDCGSAITHDWVSSDGLHMGGFIVAGVRLGISALLAGTDQVIVNYDKLGDADLAPGTSTTDAVYNGALFVLVAQLEAAYRQLLSLGGRAPKFFLTGGDAALVSEKLSFPHETLKGLVFDGLKVMLKNATL